MRSFRSIFCAPLLVALPAILAAQGTVVMDPPFPARGTDATVTYTPSGGPLAAANPVWMAVGANGFQNISEAAMTSTGGTWVRTFTVPSNATSIDLYFRNATSTTFDNNGGNGVDWHFFTADTQTAQLGVSAVSGAQGGGFLFRVWSPNSTRVSVVGSFNGFTDRRNEMRRNAGTNLWTGHVTNAASGNQYKFLLNGTTFRKDPRARQQTNSVGNSVVYDPNAYNWAGDVAFNTTDIRDIVLYQIHIGSLDRGTGSVPSNFSRILSTGRMDYIAALGISMLHVMPVFEFPGDFSGGYNPADPFAIESAYGGPNGFKDFVKASHARGIGVMQDVIHNHYGPSDLEMYRFDDPGATSGGGIYFYDSPEDLANTPFGARPDYTQTEVRNFIKDNTTMLLQEYRVDGLRWDFTKAIRGRLDGNFNVTQPIPEGISLLREINTTIAADPSLFSVAEDLAGDPLITTDTGNPNGLGFRAQWDTSFHFNVVPELAKANDADRNIGTLANAVTNTDFSKINYIESHDEVWETNSKDRTPWRFDPTNGESYRARKMAGIAGAILLTTEGVPLMFQGSEVLELGGANRSWDDSEAIDWSRLATPNVARFNDLYRSLIKLRRNTHGTTAGLKGDTTNAYYTGAGGPKVMAYLRSNNGTAPGDIVVVMINASATNYAAGFEIGMPQTGTWYEQVNSDNTRFGTDFTNRGVGQTVNATGAGIHGQPTRGSVAIGPYSVVVLSRARLAEEKTAWMGR